MATKSMLKNITIKDRVSCRKLVCALEHSRSISKSIPQSEIFLSKKKHDVTGKQIKAMFGK